MHLKIIFLGPEKVMALTQKRFYIRLHFFHLLLAGDLYVNHLHMSYREQPIHRRRQRNDNDIVLILAYRGLSLAL